MIDVCRHAGGFVIAGHAGYAEHGKDIVCAAISTLLQTFITSVEELTGEELKTEITAGYAAVEYENLSGCAQVLLDSFFIGARMIADEYPQHVKLTRRGGH